MPVLALLALLALLAAPAHAGSPVDAAREAIARFLDKADAFERVQKAGEDCSAAWDEDNGIDCVPVFEAADAALEQALDAAGPVIEAMRGLPQWDAADKRTLADEWGRAYVTMRRAIYWADGLEALAYVGAFLEFGRVLREVYGAEQAGHWLVAYDGGAWAADILPQAAQGLSQALNDGEREDLVLGCVEFAFFAGALYTTGARENLSAAKRREVDNALRLAGVVMEQESARALIAGDADAQRAREAILALARLRLSGPSSD